MRRIIFMHTVVGGGHTSATKAIIEALENLYGDQVETTMIDVLKDYAPKPLDLAPEAYSRVVKAPQLYRQIYEIGDGRRRAGLLTRSVTLYSRRRADQLLREHHADAMVSTFHFTARPVLDALERRGHPVPFINVVTDLVTIAPVWFDARADATIVPTEPAYHQAILAGIPTERLHRIGLPVSPRFVPAPDKQAVRQKLGWPTDTTMVLLMAGGNGVGPLATLAEAIVASGLPVVPVIITGRNRRMANRLRSASWAGHCLVYDFVEDMPALMQAADLLITKAGPGTITEALNTHLPMIIYSRTPGQEEGNTEYVTHTGAGYWAPKKRDLIATLRYLLSDPEALQRATDAAARLASPNAATDIAKLVMNMASGRPPRSG
jgi:1,2-diacylglycerol 3-beta-galactosyltransferase